MDVDGTLLNSNDAHARAWAEALAAFEIQVSFEQVRPLIGMGGDKLLPAVAGIDAESKLGRALSERRAAIFKARYLPEVKPFPKVRALLLSYELRLEPVTIEDAEWAAERWQRGEGLSLADRLCLALAERADAEALTADTAWGSGGRVRQIR